MSTSTLGRCGFEDAFVPAKGKNEWGIETLTRKMMGARSLLDTFLATLEQGQAVGLSGFTDYFLQSWEPDENPNVATVTLNYKGLPNGTPAPKRSSEFVSSVGTASASYATENDGKGRIYRTKPIWKSALFPNEFPSDQLTQDAVIVLQSVYAIAASMQFTYIAAQTTYRYVTIGRTVAAKYDTIGFNYTQVPENVRITTSDGAIFGQVPWQQFFGLAPVQRQRVVSFSSEEVIGTPFWEAQDVVRLQLEPAEISEGIGGE